MADLKEIEAFFFEAMRAGYAAGSETTKIPKMPGFKGIPYNKGKLYLLDCWAVSPVGHKVIGNKSVGQTIIWENRIPVWWMQYSGRYPKEVIVFLRKALLENYSRNIFCGGRGPKIFSEGSLIYINDPDPGGRFDFFSGKEKILVRSEDGSSGLHRYRGGCLEILMP